jgi:hypothetical protein
MVKAKYHIIRLAVGQECPAGYDSRTVRGATICTKKLSMEEVAFAAAARVPEVVPVADPAVDELEALLAGMGMGQQAVAEWGGEEGMEMEQDGGARRRRSKSHRKAHRKVHRKSHRKSHRKAASRRKSRRQA